MGACVGQLLGEHFTISEKEKRFLLECGVAAGLAAAFSAPLAGVIFLMEEITFSFQPQGGASPHLLPQFRLTSSPSSFSVSGPVSTYQCT